MLVTDTADTSRPATVSEIASGDMIVVDARGACVRAEVLRIEQVNYPDQTLVVVYREADTGIRREWPTGFGTWVLVDA